MYHKVTQRLAVKVLPKETVIKNYLSGNVNLDTILSVDKGWTKNDFAAFGLVDNAKLGSLAHFRDETNEGSYFFNIVNKNNAVTYKLYNIVFDETKTILTKEYLRGFK